MQPDCTTPPLKTCTKCSREYPATLEYFYARAGSKLEAWCKACCREKRRDWSAANVERVATYNRAWYAANVEKTTEYHRARRVAHPEYNPAYFVANREKINERRRACRAAHPESVAADYHNRRARKLGNGGTHTAEDIRAQYARQNGRCIYCHEKVGGTYHRDHVMPLVLGGSNGPENIVIACPTCNLSKGAKHPQEFFGRLL